MLYFLTGNKNKLREVQAILPQVAQLDIDLPEIQEIDTQVIIREKLQAASAHAEGEFIVEDTSLSLECLHGLPGPLIKWFLKSLGNEGLAEIAGKLGNDKAVAQTIFGYAKSRNEIHFFDSELAGKIVSPRGENGFGWDPIFQPEGYEKTFAEMSLEEKNSLSMRRKALSHLRKFLGNSG